VPELRIDQLTGMRTLIAPERATRPSDYATGRREAASGPDECPFCPGHEGETPPEAWANRPGGGEPDTPGWEQRAVPNLYPALVAAPPERASVWESGLTSAADPLLASARTTAADLFGGAPAAGAHEVIVNSPRHVPALAGLGLDELRGAMAAWRQRIAAQSESASLVHLLVNEGPAAGATREHTHAQLAALPFVPPLVARERERFTAYNQRTMGAHLLEDVVVEEVRRRERLVAIDGEAALFCPWASRAPYELRLVPRTAKARFEEDDRGAELMHRALRALAGLLGEGVALNLWVRTAPRDAEEFHWHIDLLPRLGTLGGFELGTGVDINPVAPEAAAAALREALPE
jgi:UDPglucose--hexose-1-phosphate uridylyltransferase